MILAMLQVHGKKCTKELEYSMDLDITRFCAKHPATEGWGYYYKLGGGILHHGSGSRGGHYIYFQNVLHDRWIHKDDTCKRWVQDPLSFKKEIVGLVYHKYVVSGLS